MQLLFDESEEFGRVPGLGIFPGRVVRFPETPALKVPHMGWNQIRKQGEPPHLRGIDDGAFVYFVHSYYVVPADPSLTATTTEYGIEFTSAIARDNVFAAQYHPEKSQTVGLKILENFGASWNDAAERISLTAYRPEPLSFVSDGRTRDKRMPYADRARH